MRTYLSLRTLFQTITTMTIAAGCGGQTLTTDGGSSSDASTMDSGVDRTGFDLMLCDPNGYNPVSGLSAQNPVEYVELRRESAYDMLQPRIVAKDGTACAKATMQAECASKLESLRSSTGWKAAPDPRGGPVEVYDHEYLAYTRGDEVGAVSTVPDLVQFLSPIDTVKDAALIAIANGHRIVCDGRPNGRKIADGWEIITQTGDDCGPGTGIDEHVVQVSSNGSFQVTKTVRIRKGNDMCAIGRRPEGLERTRTNGQGVGAFFARAAYLEAASVVAFERLAKELRAHGAPEDLVRAALDAAADEVRHARATKKIAEKWGAHMPEVHVEDREVRDLFSIAIENAIEGQVRETFGALVATYQASRAADRPIARAMKQISEDETRHASLAWRVAEWIEARLTEHERAEIARARENAARELRRDLEISEDADVIRYAGMPSVRDALALFDAASPALWS
jgi:hypothetical protein